MKRLLYILSGNLSTTPRALQSVKSAIIDYNITIVGVNRGSAWKVLDEKLVREYQLNYLSVSLQRKPFLGWLVSSVICKIAEIISPLFSQNIHINAWASSKSSYLIAKELEKLTDKFDLIMAHSYGSLYPAYSYSQKHKIPFIFDIEDYHPGEKCSKEEKVRREFLMKKLLPFAGCITYASPLIGEYSFGLIDSVNVTDKRPDDSESSETKSLIKQNNRILVTNSFSQNEFSFRENNREKVKFVWFSQNINENRGLELVIPALEKFSQHIGITLIGNLKQEFYNNFLHKYKDLVEIKEPIFQKDLHQMIGLYDIGLAVEISTFDINKDIALSNKIFSYAQAGLYILFTDTITQKQFLNENPQLGILSEQNIPGIEKQIDWIVQNIDKIRAGKAQRFEYAKKLSWENESLKLQEIWEKVLS